MFCEKNFKDKFGIITGAASGIGRATAVHLAEAGAGVSLVDIAKDQLDGLASEIEKTGALRPLAVTADVSSVVDVDRVAHATLAAFGRIDFLVTSAGILRRTVFPEIRPDEWDLVLAINLRGPYLCCKAVVPAMMKTGTGNDCQRGIVSRPLGQCTGRGPLHCFQTWSDRSLAPFGQGTRTSRHPGQCLLPWRDPHPDG